MIFADEENSEEREIVNEFLEKHYKIVEDKLSKKDWELRNKQGQDRMLELYEKIHSEKTTRKLVEEMQSNLEMEIRDLQSTTKYARVEAAFEKYMKYEKFATGDTLLQKELREIEWKVAKELAEAYSKKHCKELGVIREDLRVRLLAEFLVNKELWLLGKLNALLAMEKPPHEKRKRRLPQHVVKKEKPKKKKYEWEENMMYG